MAYLPVSRPIRAWRTYGAAVLLSHTLASPDASAAETRVTATTTTAATSDYVVWISPLGMLPGVDSSGNSKMVVIRGHTGNTLRVGTTQAGDLQWVRQTLTLPDNVRIQAVITCYGLTNAASYISQVRLTRETIPPTASVLLDNPTDLTSTTAVCTETPASGLVVGGAMTLGYRLNFANTSDYIDFGAIGVRVGP